MARGSEQPKWAWTRARHCDDCGRELLLKEIGLFRYQDGQDFIRCFDCVNARVAASVLKTRKDLGLPT